MLGKNHKTMIKEKADDTSKTKLHRSFPLTTLYVSKFYWRQTLPFHATLSTTLTGFGFSMDSESEQGATVVDAKIAARCVRIDVTYVGKRFRNFSGECSWNSWEKCRFCRTESFILLALYICNTTIHCIYNLWCIFLIYFIVYIFLHNKKTQLFLNIYEMCAVNISQRSIIFSFLLSKLFNINSEKRTAIMNALVNYHTPCVYRFFGIIHKRNKYFFVARGFFRHA